MKKNDGLVFLVWIVILTSIGFATYYGVKSLNSNDAQKQIEKEKSLLPEEKENATSTTRDNIIKKYIKKNTTKTKTVDESTSNKSNDSSSPKSNKNKSTTNNSGNTQSNNKESNTSNNSITNSTTPKENTNNNYQQTENTNLPPSINMRRTLLFEGTGTKEETSTRYGTIINKTYEYNIKKYSDGTEEKNITRIIYDFNKSGYNGTTQSLAAEAGQVLNARYSEYERVHNLINQHRATAGASALTLDRQLCLAATIRAMERAYAFDVTNIQHMRPNGQKFITVLDDLGISKGSAYGENVTSGELNSSRDVEDVYPADSAVNDWYYSQGHRSNFENREYNVTGIGAYQLGNTKYWVQIFLKR